MIGCSFVATIDVHLPLFHIPKRHPLRCCLLQICPSCLSGFHLYSEVGPCPFPYNRKKSTQLHLIHLSSPHAWPMVVHLCGNRSHPVGHARQPPTCCSAVRGSVPFLPFTAPNFTFSFPLLFFPILFHSLCMCFI